MEDYDDSPFYVEFDKDWFDDLQEEILQIRILADLGEYDTELTNDEGVKEMTHVHGYRVELL